MKAGGKTCAKCGCDMDSKKEKYEDEEDDMRKGGMACMKCGGKMHKTGGTISSCMKCGGGKYTFGGKTGWMSKKKNDVSKYQSGGNIIYVSPNDPIGMKKYQAYQDSTNLVNIQQKILDEFNKSRKPGYKFTPDKLNSLSNLAKDENTLGNPTLKALRKKQDEIVKRTGYKPIGRQVYTDERMVNDFTNAGFLQQLGSAIGSAFDYSEPTIKDVYSFTNDVYKKPVQKVILKEKTQSVPVKTQKPVQPIVYKKQDVRVPVMSVEETTKMMDGLAKDRKEKEDYAAYEKWIAENPLAEPEPQKNDEMEIDPWKIINMPTKSPELIQRNDPFKPKVYAGPGLAGRVKSYVPGEMWTKGPLEEGRSLQEQYADNPSVILDPEEFIRNREVNKNKKMKRNKTYSFGGAISSMKQYQTGGEVSKTGNRNTDLALTLNNMFKVMKAENDKKYTGVTSGGYKYYRDKEGLPVVQIPDSELQYDEEGNYDNEIMVKSSKVANTLDAGKQGKASNVQLDYSLPNWGYAKLEQKKLNDLIQAEIKAGAKDLELLVEDDIIGENTLKAMNKFEGKGYTRPEGFKDKWLKKYAEDYAKGVRMQVPGVTAPLTPKVPGKESVKTTEVKVEEDIFGDFVTKKKTDKEAKKVSVKEEKNETSIFDILGGASSMMGGFTSGLYDATAGLINMAGKAGEFIEKYQDKSDTKEARLKAKREKLDRYIENQKYMPLFQEKANKLYQQKMEEDKKMALLANEKATKINEKINKEKQQKRIELVDNMMYMPMFEDKVEKIKQQIQDDQYEKLARDVEAEYATEAKEAKEQSYKNFGKKSAAASAEAAMKKFNASKASSNNTNVNVGQPNVNVGAAKQNTNKIIRTSTSFDKTMKYMDELQRKNNNNEAYKSLSSEMNNKYYNVNESNATKVKQEIFSKPSKGEGFDGKDDYLSKMLDIVLESEKNYGAPISGYNELFESNMASVRYNNKTNERIIQQVYPKDKVEKNLKVLNSAFSEVEKSFNQYYDEGKKKGIKGKDLVLYAYDRIKKRINNTRNKINAENDPRFKPL